MTPLVSVIIPTRAHEPVTLAVDSLMAQTEQSIECIITVDHEGRGQSWARNQGVRRARGRYLLFSDADIAWQPTALTHLLETIRRPPPPGWRLGYAYGRYQLTHQGAVLDTLCWEEWDWTLLKIRNIVSTMSLMPRPLFTRIGGFDERLRRLEDWDLWLRLGERGYAGRSTGTLIFQTPLRSGVTFSGAFPHDDWERIVRTQRAV